MRIDNRKADELRRIKITKNYLTTAEGSVLIEIGDTRVLCAATVKTYRVRSIMFILSPVAAD